MIRLRASHDGPVSRIARRAALLITLAMLATGSGVAAAQVAVPGGPDAPPPDPPAPTRPANPAPTRPSNPAPTNPTSPSTDPTQPEQTGPTPEELRQQRLAEQRRAAARRAAILKARREAIAAAKRERAAEFRDLAAFTAMRNTIREDTQNAAAGLNRAADGAKLVALSPDPTSPDGGGSGGGTPLLYLLLIASAVSAGLVFLPVALERRRASQAAGESSRLIAAVEARAVFVERHRVELAGVASACLLVALLIAVGLV